MDRKRIRIRITGIVQGVGFRPTVFNYAEKHHLSGWVLNSESGVTIEIEGTKTDTDAFSIEMREFPPPLAVIEHFSIEEIPVENSSDFTIKKSTAIAGAVKIAAISPDIAVCSACRNDIFTLENRRFHYAFTNCTDCGPRFTIIADRPYDRHLTSMRDFTMCPECLAEYEDPRNRRFHAQPNACPVCGPSLSIPGSSLTSDEALKKCIEGLLRGEIWCVKGLGGFNLVCDAKNTGAVTRLRTAKKRLTKAFAIMARNISVVQTYCLISGAEEKALTSVQAPIVLLKRRGDDLNYLSCDNNRLGFVLPYTPLHLLLMEHFEILVFTSANRADEPIAITDDEAESLKVGGLCDNILTHNRPILHRADDSIMCFVDNAPMMIRRSRGFVPMVIKSAVKTKEPLLALGANLKNTFALARDENIWFSQHIGDLVDAESYDFLVDQVKDFETLLDTTPEKVIIDAHPAMETRDAAACLHPSLPTIDVFHHSAHIWSVIGEHNLFETKLTGIAADGTGYGEDETIWGFEAFSFDSSGKKLERTSSILPFPLPGGDICMRETKRIALSLLKTAGLDAGRFHDDATSFLIDRGINSPMTSSLGRLFDGVSALCGICDYSDYEARGAILLQKAAEDAGEIAFTEWEPVFIENNGIRQWDWRSMISEILQVKENSGPQVAAAMFHHRITCVIKAMAIAGGYETVALSGGVFQNTLLTQMVTSSLKNAGFRVFRNNMIPINDAGISFGQLVCSREAKHTPV
ncbi:carbamoyltransferase HypF [Myxococcota bacterium]|nr:carbamoyltransferase HypF [Myxococcota bacterium]MBU1380105.1 carbamoyltransferase HypF [Myxococcota bacterium]MBU1499233.1 carbamoyltransferase HypF [Myxococcota bacterium]